MPARPSTERADALAMTTTVPTEFAQALQALGLAGAERGEGEGVRPLQGEALTGGVSSDTLTRLVATTSSRVCTCCRLKKQTRLPK